MSRRRHPSLQRLTRRSLTTSQQRDIPINETKQAQTANAQSRYGSIAMTHKSDTGLAAHARRPRPNMLSLQPNNRPKASRAPATAGQRPTIPTQRADASCHLTSNKLSCGSELRTGDSREKGRLPLLVTRSRLCNTGRALVRMVLKGAGAGKRKVRGRSGLRVIGYEHQPA